MLCYVISSIFKENKKQINEKDGVTQLYNRKIEFRNLICITISNISFQTTTAMPTLIGKEPKIIYETDSDWAKFEK